MTRLGHLLTLFAALGLLAATLSAQPDPNAAKSTEIELKARKLDLLNHLLPLLLKKDQINAILSGIEQCRAKEKEIETREANEMRAFETRIDQAIEAGIDKGAIPPVELLKELNTLFRGFAMRRVAVRAENAEKLVEVLKSKLDSGQQAAASNSVDVKTWDSRLDPEKMELDEKLTVFVQAILLDRATYDVLIKMAAKAG
ncbi:MAG: hypothetical protein KJZ62_08120 [Fimbriimonadaceae bacterium]|nr:hypothetical protein [Fimbriimonadaceae bacterium]MCC6351641.1 hypothetical protein [Fimbriimonadaceae bacterium]MCL4285055.1 hypothetical protein [Fimbriimonadaceae bacterium]QOJ10566.1 MAG: hypothetical protein HRU74_00295 [Chthonomonadaceae bacterium]